MLDHRLLIEAIDEYIRAENEKDKSSWMALFDENARHEDPVGAKPIRSTRTPNPTDNAPATKRNTVAIAMEYSRKSTSRKKRWAS